MLNLEASKALREMGAPGLGASDYWIQEGFDGEWFPANGIGRACDWMEAPDALTALNWLHASHQADWRHDSREAFWVAMLADGSQVTEASPDELFVAICEQLKKRQQP